MADGQVDFNSAPPPDFNPAPPPTNPDDARKTFIQNHPSGPVEGQAALSAAYLLSPVIHPAVTAQHPDIVSQQLYGSPMKPTALRDRLKNTVDDAVTRLKIAALTTPRFFGSTANDKQIEELKKSLHPAEQTVKELPKQVISSLMDMGMQVGTGLAGAIGSGVGAQIGGVALGPLGAVAGLAAGEYLPLRQQFDSTISAQYDAMMDWRDKDGKGVNPWVARGVSVGMGAMMTALNFVKIGEIPGVRQGESFLEKTMLKAAMKIGLSGRAGAIVLGSIEQGAMGGAITGANLLANEFAKTLTDEQNVPHESAVNILKQMGISAGVQTAIGTPMVALGGLDMEGPVGREIQKDVSKVEESQKVSPEAPQQAPEPHPIEISTKEKLATATVGDIVERPPEVPTAEKPKVETPRMTEEQGKALDEATRSAEGTADYIEKRPEIEKLNTQIEDLQAKVKAGREEFAEQLESARAEKVAAVKSLRDQIRQRTETNRMIRNIRDLDTSKIPNEFKEPLEAIRENFTAVKPTAKTLDRLQGIRQAIEDGTAPTVFPARDLARFNELSKYPLRDLPAEDLKTVHDAIMAYYTAGRDSRIIHDRDLAIQSQDAVQRAIEEIGPAKITKDLERFQKAHPQLTPEEAKAQFSQLTKGGAVEDTKRFVKNLARWYKASNMGYESMLSYLGGGEDSLLYRVGAKMVDAGDDVYNAKKYEYSDPIFKWLEDKKLNMADFLNERRKIDVPGFSGEMERGHVIAMAGLKSTESGWESLKNGFALQGDKEQGKIYHLPESSLNAILATMDETDRGFLQQVLDLGKRTGVDMGATFRKMYGYDLKLLDPYYPIYRVMSELGLPFEEEILRQRDQSSFAHAGVDKSHTIERVGSTKPVWVRNAGNDIMDVVDSSAMFTGLGEPVRNASRLLFNPDFAAAVKGKFGEEFYKQMTDGLKAVAGTKKPLNAIERFTLNIRNRGIGAVLGFNVSTAAINRVLVERSLAGYVPAGDWTKGQAYVAMHPKSTHEYLLENSTLYRQIWEGGSMQEIQDVLAAKGSTKGLGGAFTKVQKASMLPIKVGFAGAAKGEMWSAIIQARREMKEGAPSLDLQRAADLSDRDGPNLTEQQKDEAAIKYAEYVVKRTHANPREMYAANIKRQGVLGMLSGTLMSEKNALLQLGIRRAVDMKTPGGGKRFAKYLVVGVLGEALTIAAIRTGIREGGAAIQSAVTGKKEKKQKGILADAITELASNTVGLGFGVSSAVYPVEQAITSKGQPASTNTSLIGQFETDIVKMIQGVKAGITGKSQKARDKGWGDAFESFMAFAVPMVTKIPYKHGVGDVVGAIRKVNQ